MLCLSWGCAAGGGCTQHCSTAAEATNGRQSLITSQSFLFKINLAAAESKHQAAPGTKGVNEISQLAPFPLKVATSTFKKIY